MSSLGTFLEVQWLRRRAANAGGAGLKPHMLRGHLKKKNVISWPGNTISKKYLWTKNTGLESFKIVLPLELKF